MAPILPPPPSSLSNRTPRSSKAPPRLLAPRSSPARAGADENTAPNFDGPAPNGDGSWAAFGGRDRGNGGGDGGPSSPTFMSSTDGDAIFSGDEGGGGAGAAGTIPAATAAAFGLSYPLGGGQNGGGKASQNESSTNPFASPTSGAANNSSSGARPLPAPSLQDEAIEVMRAMSPPTPRREVRQDFDTTPNSDSDWAQSPGGGGGWTREPIENGTTGLPPVQPPLSDQGSDSEANQASSRPGPLGRTGGRGGGSGGGRRPPIGGASARPPRPGALNPTGAAAAAAPSSTTPSSGGLPPPPGTPTERRRGRLGRRGRSASPAAGGRRGLRNAPSSSDGEVSDASAGTSSAAPPNSQPSPRRRSRSRSAAGGAGGGRRGRSRSQSRNGGGSAGQEKERRGRSKSRGRSSSRNPGDNAATASGARTPSRSARSRSRTRGSGAEPTTPGGSRRSRSSSRTRASSSSSALGGGSNTNRSRSLSRSRNEAPSNPTTPSSRRARSRSATRPRGGPPLSASAGTARSRSRSIGGSMTMNYASDGELCNQRPPLLQRRSNTTGAPTNGASSSSSVTSETTGATQRISNRMRSNSHGGDSSSSTSCGGPIAAAGSTPGAHNSYKQSSNANAIKRTNSFTNLREKLFGDSVSPEARRSYLPPRTPGGGRVDAAEASSNTGNNGNGSNNNNVSSGASVTGSISQQPEAVYTRTLLTASVYHNQATDLWITTINTNQDPKKTTKSNASRYLKAFSFNTEREARESAYANAPPKMIPFSGSPHCFICRGKFALFRRSCHCRNCGVAVCSNCSCTWPSKMIPETYNMKSSKNVKVCKSCNFVAGAFRRALTEGQYDEAVALYNTGNINLRCPFANVKGGGEVLFPIHCAAAGGNLDLLRWLVDVHHCPIKMVRTGNKNRERGVDEPILTSKGRTVLGLAMGSQRVDVLRYLVSEKSMSVHEVKDLKTSLTALEAVLNAFPRDYDDLPDGADPAMRNLDIESTIGGMYRSDAGGDTTDGGSDFGEDDTSSDDEGHHHPHDTTGGFPTTSAAANAAGATDDDDDESTCSTIVADACILCYENSIDCVITPCGHQICCLECSANLTACPVCNSEGTFIRIYKP